MGRNEVPKADNLHCPFAQLSVQTVTLFSLHCHLEVGSGGQKTRMQIEAHSIYPQSMSFHGNTDSESDAK